MIPNAMMISAPIKSLIVLKVSEPHSQNQILEMNAPRLSLNPQAEKPISTAVKKLMAMGTAKYFQSPSLLMSLKVPAYAFMPFRMFLIISEIQTSQVLKTCEVSLLNINQFIFKISHFFNGFNFHRFRSFLF